MNQLNRLRVGIRRLLTGPEFCWCIPADHDPVPCGVCQVLSVLINGVLVPVLGALPVLVLVLADRAPLPWWGAALATVAGGLGAARLINVVVIEDTP